MVVSNALQNLRLDIQGGTLAIKPGSDPVERVITIHNRGQETADVELWLDPTDAHASPLLQWGLFDKSDAELSLGPGQKIDVRLSFLIPLQAEPGYYSYEIRLRSPQYPKEDIRRAQQLQVVYAEGVQLRNEPRVTVEPVTDSNHAHPLAAGETFTLTITVENPSRRTDRFFLHCSDLDTDWYSVIYPPNPAMTTGKLSFTDGLELNPGETGEIRCQIHPPQQAPAGQYFPTLQVKSRVRSELVLLRVVYFTLAVNDRFAAEITPKVQSLPNPNLLFEVVLANQGNIPRQLSLAAWDVERLLRYHFDPGEVALAPGEDAIAQITVEPRRWWHRLWRLKDRDVTFEVLIENRLAQAEENGVTPALPDPLPTGEILYKSQRRWLFRLLLLLFGLGTAAALLWVLWEFLVWRPSLRPTIVDFSPAQETFKADGAPLTFSWEITNPERVRRLVLRPKGTPSGEVEEITYRLNDNTVEGSFVLDLLRLPPGLAEANCTVVNNPPTGLFSPLLRAYRQVFNEPPDVTALRCSAVEMTSATDAGRNLLPEGNYAFELEAYGVRQPYRKDSPPDNGSGEETAAGVNSPGPEETVSPSPFISGAKPRSQPSPEVERISDRAILRDVVVNPADPPKIVAFGASSAQYQVAGPVESPAAAGEQVAIAPILLNWTVDNPSDILALELFSLAADGSANTEPRSYEFGNGEIPPDLAGFCTASTATQLICENVPTSAREPGDYTFFLRVIPVGNGDADTMAGKAPLVSILPLAPVINRFEVNGVDVLEQPRQVLPLNPALETIEILLAWEVDNATQVELLPAPGVIEGNSITYTLSTTPGVEKIELRAVNEAGDAVTRSVVIEKAAAYNSNGNFPGAAGQLPMVPLPPPPGGLSAPASPLPPSVEGLEPVRTPPQAD